MPDPVFDPSQPYQELPQAASIPSVAAAPTFDPTKPFNELPVNHPLAQPTPAPTPTQSQAPAFDPSQPYHEVGTGSAEVLRDHSGHVTDVQPHDPNAPQEHTSWFDLFKDAMNQSGQQGLEGLVARRATRALGIGLNTLRQMHPELNPEQLQTLYDQKLREAQQTLQQKYAAQQAVNPETSFANFLPYALGHLVGGFDPSMAVVPGGSLLTRMAGQAAVGGIGNTIGQLGNVQDGMQEKFDPKQVGEAAVQQAAAAGILHGIGRGWSAFRDFTTHTPEPEAPVEPEGPQAEPVKEAPKAAEAEPVPSAPQPHVMPAEVQEGIRQMIDSGKSLDEIKGAYPDWATAGPNESVIDWWLKARARGDTRPVEFAPHTAPKNTLDTEPSLPKELAGAKPRFNHGSDGFSVDFDSDLDKAAYITSQARKSAADEQYRQFLRDHGYTDAEIDQHGQTVRAQIKEQARQAKGTGDDTLYVERTAPPPEIHSAGPTQAIHNTRPGTEDIGQPQAPVDGHVTVSNITDHDFSGRPHREVTVTDPDGDVTHRGIVYHSGQVILEDAHGNPVEGTPSEYERIRQTADKTPHAHEEVPAEPVKDTRTPEQVKQDETDLDKMFDEGGLPKPQQAVKTRREEMLAARQHFEGMTPGETRTLAPYSSEPDYFRFHHVAADGQNITGHYTFDGKDIDNYEIKSEGGARQVGPRDIRNVLTGLQDAHPTAETLSGYRMTGARRNTGSGPEFVTQKLKPRAVAEPQVKSEGELPPIPSGHVRMWRGGAPGEETGGGWYSSNRSYAEGYSSGQLYYSDVPRNHPAFNGDYPEQSVDNGFTVNHEFGPDEVKGQPVSGGGSSNLPPSEPPSGNEPPSDGEPPSEPPVEPEDAKYAGNINLHRIMSDEAIDKVIRDEATRQGDPKSVSFADETAKAKEMLQSMTPAQLLDYRPSRSEIPAHEQAIRIAHAQAAMDVAELGKQEHIDAAQLDQALAANSLLQKANSEYASAVGRGLGIRRVTVTGQGIAEEIQHIHEEMAANGVTPEEIARKAASVSDVPGAVQKLLKDARDPTYKDVLLEAWYNNILSNPLTHAMYYTGTASHLGLEIGMKGLASVGGQFTRLSKSADRVYGREVAARVYGMLQGVGAAFNPTAVKNTLGELLGDESTEFGQAPSVLHGMEDFMKGIIDTSHYYGEAVRQSIKDNGLSNPNSMGEFVQPFKDIKDILADPPEEMVRKVTADTRRIQYKDNPDPFSNIIENFRNSPKQQFGKDTAVFVTNVMLPFLRRTSGAVRASIRYAGPAGLMDRYQVEGLRSGGAEAHTAMARFVAGTAIAAWVAHKVATGDVTGSGPADYKMRAQMLSTGWRPYSYRDAEGTYHEYTHLGPVAGAIGLTANAVEALRDSGDMGSYYEDVAKATFHWFTGLKDISALKDLTPVVQSMDAQQGEVSAKNWAAGMAGSAVPAGVRAVNQSSIDTVKRNSSDKGDEGSLLGMMKNRVKSALPAVAGLTQGSTSLPARHDVFGREQQTDVGYIPKSKTDVDPAVKEVARLSSLAGKVLISPVSAADVKDTKLSTRQFEAYQELAGKYVLADIRQTMQTPEWKAMSDAEKWQEIKDIQTAQRKNARELLFPPFDPDAPNAR